MRIDVIRESILSNLEERALEDESLGQEWYDQQSARLEAWVDPSASEWKRVLFSGDIPKRFFGSHPHPFFVERENARLQSLKNVLSDDLFARLNYASKGPVYQAYKRISEPLSDPHYAEGLFYREEHFPAKAEDLLAGMIQEIKESYEESLRLLERDKEAYEDARNGSSTRRDIFRELAGSFSENVQSHGSMSMESGLGRGKDYSYSEKSVSHEVPREIWESQDFFALYEWAKDYYQQSIGFLEV